MKSPSPVAAAYTTGKAASGMWKAKFDLTNNGAKDTKKVSFFECTYDTNGKISGPAAQMLQSEAMIDIKPKAKGSTEIAFMSDGLGPNYQVALMIHTVTWSDDSKWHDPANGMCPASLK